MSIMDSIGAGLALCATVAAAPGGVAKGLNAWLLAAANAGLNAWLPAGLAKGLNAWLLAAAGPGPKGSCATAGPKGSHTSPTVLPPAGTVAASATDAAMSAKGSHSSAFDAFAPPAAVTSLAAAAAPAAGADDVGGVGGAGAVRAGAVDLSSRPVGRVLVAAPGDVPWRSLLAAAAFISLGRGESVRMSV
jgi:hypothetical protein